MKPLTRQHEAAERTAMRRWLREQGIDPVAMGQEPSDTELLMKQVFHAGGDPQKLMAEGRETVDEKKRLKNEEGNL